jgi:hypothetical protein
VKEGASLGTLDVVGLAEFMAVGEVVGRGVGASGVGTGVGSPVGAPDVCAVWNSVGAAVGTEDSAIWIALTFPNRSP